MSSVKWIGDGNYLAVGGSSGEVKICFLALIVLFFRMIIHRDTYKCSDIFRLKVTRINLTVHNGEAILFFIFK